jgi:hypothetical protein
MFEDAKSVRVDMVELDGRCGFLDVRRVESQLEKMSHFSIWR